MATHMLSNVLEVDTLDSTGKCVGINKTMSRIWAQQASTGMHIPAIKKITLFSPNEWEEFVEEWLTTKNQYYTTIERISSEERDEYSNLILMCKKHHKKIDDQFNHYTVPKLKELKVAHETWVSLKTSNEQCRIEPFSIFQLFYNSFWVEEHTKFIQNDPLVYDVQYRNLIYTKINRCRVLLEGIIIPTCKSMLLINNLYEEFDKPEENYTDINAIAFQLNNSLRNELKRKDNKNIVSIARSLVTFLRSQALNGNISPDSFKQCCLDFFGYSDQLLESYLVFDSYDKELEGKILDRIEELL